MPKRDLSDLAELLAQKALGDQIALVKLASDPEVPDDILGFHAQQAIEKLLKAALSSRSHAPPRSHDIGYLLTLLADAGVEAPPNAEELDSLTPWAAELRYASIDDVRLDREGVVGLVMSLARWVGLLLEEGELG